MAQKQEQDFAEFVREFGHGSTNRTLTERLREVVAACSESNGKGSITLKIGVDAKQGLAELKVSVSVKKPEPALPGGHYYTTPDGDLLDEDPRQMKLNPKVIDAPQTKPRIVPISAANNGNGNTQEG